MAQLPPELWAKILSYGKHYEFKSLATVSSYFHTIYYSQISNLNLSSSLSNLSPISDIHSLITDNTIYNINQRKFINLRILICDNTRISNYSFELIGTHFKKLRVFSAKNCNYVDETGITQLANLPNLANFSFSTRFPRMIMSICEAVSKILTLEVLYLDVLPFNNNVDNKIGRCFPLTDLCNLVDLNLGTKFHPNHADIKKIAELPNLKNLVICARSLNNKSIEVLSRMDLFSLTLTDAVGISNIGSLAVENAAPTACKNLRVLSIERATMSLQDMAQLAELSQLTSLELKYCTGIKKEDIEFYWHHKKTSKLTSFIWNGVYLYSALVLRKN